jgi:homoprotocatechuate degradation regulator HpaR
MPKTKPAPSRATLPSTDRSLPIALMRAREKVMAPIRQMLTESGITEQQWRVLRVLAEYGPQDATAVSERACLLMPSLARIIKTLSERGLVSRVTDQNDKRRQPLTITAKGQAIIDDNLAQATVIVAGFKETLGEEGYETLLDLLSTLEQSG